MQRFLVWSALLLVLPLVLRAQPLESRIQGSAVTSWMSVDWNGRAWKESAAAKTVTDSYDPDGRLQISTLVLSSGRIQERTVREYANDHLVKMTTTDEKSSILRVTTYGYSPNSVEIQTLDPDGRVMATEIQTLDRYGFIAKSDFFDPNKTLLQTKRYQYDSKGALVGEAVRVPDGSQVYQLKSTFDDFDAANNWTTRTDREVFGDTNPRPRYVLRRVLHYFSDDAPPAKSSEAHHSPVAQGPAATMALLAASHPGAGSVVIAAGMKRMEGGVIEKGSCDDFVEAVYQAAGFSASKRQKIYTSSEFGSYADPALVQSGDWLFYDHMYGLKSEHSGIFLAWLDFEDRIALTMDYVGSNRAESGHYRVDDLYQIWGITRPVSAE